MVRLRTRGLGPIRRGGTHKAIPSSCTCDAAGVEWWLALIIIVGAIALVVALGYLMYKHHLHQKHHHGTKHHVTRKASVERAVRRASQDAARKYSQDASQSAVVHVQPSTRDLS